MSEPKYPHIEVQLTGKDGNAFAILGEVKNALRNNGVFHGEVEQFLNEAMSGDYSHLLSTCCKWVNVK